jgi:hypothetical protein
VLRRIFGPKIDGVAGGWRQLHNEELDNLFSSPNKIGMVKCRRMRRQGHVARIWKKEKAYRMLLGTPEIIQPIGRPKRKCIIRVIRMDL